MTKPDEKPLAWTPPDDPRVGFTAARRADGGMHLTFTDLSPLTLQHWREFSQRHLQGAERQNRNLYDLRQVSSFPPQALRLATELNQDPAAKFIRLAVVVANPQIEALMRQVGSTSLGAEIEVFTDLDKAEAWLDQPFSRLL